VLTGTGKSCFRVPGAVLWRSGRDGGCPGRARRGRRGACDRRPASAVLPDQAGAAGGSARL